MAKGVSRYRSPLALQNTSNPSVLAYHRAQTHGVHSGRSMRLASPPATTVFSASHSLPQSRLIPNTWWVLGCGYSAGLTQCILVSSGQFLRRCRFCARWHTSAMGNIPFTSTTADTVEIPSALSSCPGGVIWQSLHTLP